jgi:hypothetical protein
VLDEQLEHAVDARAPDRGPLLAEQVLDLDGAERTGLLCEHVDDALARSTALQPRARELGVHVIAPLHRARV